MSPAKQSFALMRPLRFPAKEHAIACRALAVRRGSHPESLASVVLALWARPCPARRTTRPQMALIESEVPGTAAAPPRAATRTRQAQCGRTARGRYRLADSPAKSRSYVQPAGDAGIVQKTLRTPSRARSNMSSVNTRRLPATWASPATARCRRYPACSRPNLPMQGSSAPNSSINHARRPANLAAASAASCDSFAWNAVGLGDMDACP